MASRLSPTKIILFLLLLLVAADGSASTADELDSTRRTLEDIEQRIRETTRSLEEKRVAGRQLAADLQTVEREENRVRKRIAALRRETSSLEDRIAALAAEARELKQHLALIEGLVRRRLVAMYKGSDTGALRLLFSADSPNRAAEEQEFQRRIVRRDRELLTEYRRQRAEREDALRRLESLQAERQTALKNSRLEQENLRRASRLKENLLARTRLEEAELDRQLAELRERANRLGALVKKLESTEARAYTQLDGPFARQKGRLPWPLAGRVRIAFGLSRHPDLGTLHESQGIEISVQGQQPITAVWQGQVIFADVFRGFGQLLILDHGEGYYSLYAQASRLTRKIGDQVRTGDVIAVSGSEGARGVYFEIRHHGVPLDPAAWLVAR